MKCPCGAECPTPDVGGNVGAQCVATGWSYVWDTGTGLTSLWICPACAVKARGLLKQLQAMFPRVKLRYLNFAPLEKP